MYLSFLMGYMLGHSSSDKEGSMADGLAAIMLLGVISLVLGYIGQVLLYDIIWAMFNKTSSLIFDSTIVLANATTNPGYYFGELLIFLPSIFLLQILFASTMSTRYKAQRQLMYGGNDENIFVMFTLSLISNFFIHLIGDVLLLKYVFGVI